MLEHLVMAQLRLFMTCVWTPSCRLLHTLSLRSSAQWARTSSGGCDLLAVSTYGKCYLRWTCDPPHGLPLLTSMRTDSP